MPTHAEAGPTLLTEFAWLNSRVSKPDGLPAVCQCGTSRLTRKTFDKERLLASFFSYAFLDQFVYSNFGHIHGKFKDQFPGPKLVSHGSAGHASPAWLLTERGTGAIEINWERVVELSSRLLSEGLLWVVRNDPHADGRAPETFFRELTGITRYGVPQEFSKMAELIAAQADVSVPAGRP